MEGAASNFTVEGVHQPDFLSQAGLGKRAQADIVWGSVVSSVYQLTSFTVVRPLGGAGSFAAIVVFEPNDIVEIGRGNFENVYIGHGNHPMHRVRRAMKRIERFHSLHLDLGRLPDLE